MLVRTIFIVALSAVPAFAVSSQQPSGDGDPRVIVCREPQALPGSRLLGPRVCKTNAVWAQYRQDGMEVSPDGVHDQPSEKWRSINPQACNHSPTGSSGSTSQAMQTNFSAVCF